MSVRDTPSKKPPRKAPKSKPSRVTASAPRAATEQTRPVSSSPDFTAPVPAVGGSAVDGPSSTPVDRAAVAPQRPPAKKAELAGKPQAKSAAAAKGKTGSARTSGPKARPASAPKTNAKSAAARTASSATKAKPQPKPKVSPQPELGARPELEPQPAPESQLESQPEPQPAPPSGSAQLPTPVPASTPTFAREAVVVLEPVELPKWLAVPEAERSRSTSKSSLRPATRRQLRNAGIAFLVVVPALLMVAAVVSSLGPWSADSTAGEGTIATRAETAAEPVTTADDDPAATAARREVGGELSENPAIVLSDADRTLLANGSVDERVVVILGALAASGDLEIAGFPALRGESLPLRQVALRSLDGRPLVEGDSLTQTGVQLLQALGDPYAPEATSIADDRLVLRLPLPTGEPAE